MPNFSYILNSPKKPDSIYIQRMFDGLAKRYDIFTLLTGFGMAQRWRRETIAPLRENMRLLDLGCGTGDLAIEAVKKIKNKGEVVGLDFSKEMLKVAETKFKKLGISNAQFKLVQERAENLPLPQDKPYDLVVSGFVLRNLYENISKILNGVHDSLKPNGQIRFLDLTQPKNPILRKIWRFYFFTMVGFYGFILFGKNYPIPYLPDSANRFVEPDEFIYALQAAGFREIQTKSWLWGSTTLYTALK